MEQCDTPATARGGRMHAGKKFLEPSRAGAHTRSRTPSTTQTLLLGRFPGLDRRLGRGSLMVTADSPSSHGFSDGGG
jgi:hypothetical protein